MESGCVNQSESLHRTVGKGVFVIAVSITVTHSPLSPSFLGPLIPLKLKHQAILLVTL